jgi:hypothetical protein
MTIRHWRLAAFASFGSLGIGYLGIVLLSLSAQGTSWVSLSSPAERELLVTLSLRMMGALLCATVVVVLARLPRGRTFGAWCAWMLALGAAAVLVLENVRSHAGVWGIVAIIVALHLWLVRAFYMGSRDDAF